MDKSLKCEFKNSVYRKCDESHTKEEVMELLKIKVNKQYLDDALSLKMNKNECYFKYETFNKDEIISLIDDKLKKLKL
jgi:hypothetical protein